MTAHIGLGVNLGIEAHHVGYRNSGKNWILQFFLYNSLLSQWDQVMKSPLHKSSFPPRDAESGADPNYLELSSPLWPWSSPHEFSTLHFTNAPS
jgi:hypothetical protein